MSSRHLPTNHARCPPRAINSSTTAASPLLLLFSKERPQRSRTRARSQTGMSLLSSRSHSCSQTYRKAGQLQGMKQQNRSRQSRKGVNFAHQSESSQSWRGINLAHQTGSSRMPPHLLHVLLLGGRLMSLQGGWCTATHDSVCCPVHTPASMVLALCKIWCSCPCEWYTMLLNQIGMQHEHKDMIKLFDCCRHAKRQRTKLQRTG